jgi:hypothetical protein
MLGGLVVLYIHEPWQCACFGVITAIQFLDHLDPAWR